MSLEGYLAGRLVIASLENCGRDVRRSCMDSGTEQTWERSRSTGSHSIMGDGDNQGSDRVFLTVIGSDGRYYPIEALGDSVP